MAAIKRTLEPELFLAKLAEQAERYQDMFDFLSLALKNRQDPAHFTPDERNMLSVAFKNLITPRRQTWRKIIQTKSDVEAAEKYKSYIESKL